MNRVELIEAIAAGRERHRSLVRKLGAERRDAGAELDAARSALAEAKRRVARAEDAVAVLESRIAASAGALQALESKNGKLLRDSATPLEAFRREVHRELNELRLEMPPPTVRSLATGERRLDGELVRQAYSEGPSRSRRSVALVEALKRGEEMATEIADIDDLTWRLAELLVDLPRLQVEPIGDAA